MCLERALLDDVVRICLCACFKWFAITCDLMISVWMCWFLAYLGALFWFGSPAVCTLFVGGFT